MLEEYSSSMDLCNSCPSLCQSACPIFLETGNRTYSPWGLMQIMKLVKDKKLPYNFEAAELSYKCLTCKSCTEQCEHDVNVSDVLLKARNEAVKQKKAPIEIHGFIEKFHKHNNPFSKDLLKKLKTLVSQEILDRETQIVYYASCTTICKTPEVVKDTFELFEKLKIDFVSLYTDTIQCCGYPLYSGGARYEFVDLAEINYHSLKKYKLIITGSPACAYTLKKTYADLHFDLSDKIMTINEFLKPYLKNINYKIKKNIRSKLMYHDPCYLSRYLKEIDLPREMLAEISGYQPTEFFDHKEKSMCSGQGACYSIVDKESSDNITKARLEEAKEKKIKTIVTQCPTCEHKMKLNSKNMVVKDLISYLNEAIEGIAE